MKKVIFLISLFLLPLFSNAQMYSSWFQRGEKRVCAAYNYGQFTGPNGKRHKYVPYRKSYKKYVRRKKLVL